MIDVLWGYKEHWSVFIFRKHNVFPALVTFYNREADSPHSHSCNSVTLV